MEPIPATITLEVDKEQLERIKKIGTIEIRPTAVILQVGKKKIKAEVDGLDLSYGGKNERMWIGLKNVK